MAMKNAVFCDVALCRYCANRRFGGMYRLYLQGRKKTRYREISVSRWLQSATTCNSSILDAGSTEKEALSSVLFYSNSWGGEVESKWVYSALRHQHQHLVIMMIEKLVEWWLTGETEVLGEKTCPSAISDKNTDKLPTQQKRDKSVIHIVVLLLVTMQQQAQTITLTAVVRETCPTVTLENTAWYIYVFPSNTASRLFEATYILLVKMLHMIYCANKEKKNEKRKCLAEIKCERFALRGC
jgi:hypothetical protein